MSILNETITLNNGVSIPRIGLGVFKVADENAAENVRLALVNGYRLIDTAAIYGNEVGTGEGLRRGLSEAGLKREDIFVTSKMWNNHLPYEESLKAYQDSLDRLGLDYLDLYLIHWPGNHAFKESWKAMETLYNEGKIRAIGISNFTVEQMDELMSFATVTPVLNQVELHPKLTQQTIRDYCAARNIKVQAWSPLMQGQLLHHPTLQAIADKYGKSVAQVIFRWDIQNDILLLTKSEKERRIISNAHIDDFTLSAEDMATIDSLNENLRVGPDPLTFDF